MKEAVKWGIIGDVNVARRCVSSGDRHLASGRAAAVDTPSVATAVRSDNCSGDTFRPILRFSSGRYSHKMNYIYIHPFTYN
jgi:hypothetical protein